MADKLSLEELELKANDIREDIINMLVAAGSGHSAGPLGLPISLQPFNLIFSA